MSTDLHTALEAAITARLEVARAATPGPWDAHPVHVFMDGRIQARVAPAAGGLKVFADVIAGGDFEYFRVHDPADAVRRYERELGLIERYRRLDAEPVGRLTHEEILEYDGQLELLRELIDDLLDVYPEVTL